MNTIATDALAHITSFLDTKQQAHMMGINRSSHTALRKRITWQMVKLSTTSNGPKYGRILKLVASGNLQSFPVDTITGKVLPVRHLVMRNNNLFIILWPSKIQTLEVHQCSTFNQTAPQGTHTFRVSYCPTFNQTAPQGTNTFEVFVCHAFNQTAPQGTHTFDVSYCPTFNQTAPQGTHTFSMTGCLAFNQTAPQGTHTFRVTGCRAFNQVNHG